MKKIEKKITNVVYQYESVDGKTFDNEEDCKKWEKSYESVVVASFNKIHHIDACGVDLGIPYASEDYCMIVLRPKNFDEVVVINSYIRIRTHESLNTTWVDASDIGKTLILNFGYDYDFCDVYVLEERASTIQKAVVAVIEAFEKGI